MAGALSQENNKRHFHYGRARVMMDGGAGACGQSMRADRTRQGTLSR